jgi:polysaccharide chain length determinant protein (PEP-CTERM system associated)
MNPLVQLFNEQLRELLRRKWLALGVAWFVSLLVAVGVVLRPDQYEASARIFVDTQTVLKPLMTGLAFQPDTNQQVAMLARTLISRPNVEQLRAAKEIGWKESSAVNVEREVDDLMGKIKVSPSEKGNIYLISYRDTDPGRARRLVEKLVHNFVDSNGSDKRRDSEEARKFIEEQIRAHEVKLSEAENALKNFKLRNFGVSGVPTQDYFARVSALTEEVAKLRLDMTSAEQSREALKRELANEAPQLPAEALSTQPTSPVVSEVDARLETQRRLLDDLLRRFTDEHPDVVNARRVVGTLEAQKRQEAEARAVANKTRPVGAATNPVFQKIRFALAEAEANVASLRVRLSTQQARLDQVRAVATRAPQAEAELAQLNRDYDVIRKNYEQLVSRRESASMGERIDERAPLTEFRIVDPPRTAPMPVMPNRLSISVLGAIAAVAAGIGAALGLGRLKPLVKSAKNLAELSGRPVLGTVSMVLGARALRRQRLGLVALAGAAVSLVVIQTTWIAWVAMHARV